MPLEEVFETVVRAPLVRASLEPATNALYSLSLLDRASYLSGLGDWVTDTLQSMTPEEVERNRIVTNGLYLAVMPRRSWQSFSAYLKELASAPPERLQDKLLDAYLEKVRLAAGPGAAQDELPDKQYLLSSVDRYIAFLSSHFSAPDLDEEVEEKAYSYVIDPPRMQNLIVTHLREMWDRYLAVEWRRVEPMLQDVVKAFRQIDFSGKSLLEIGRIVTGQNLDTQKWERYIRNATRFVFIPNPHIGPYLGKVHSGDTLQILFGARLPDGVEMDAPDLSRNELLVRLGALYDDSRLRILQLVARQGELRSQDIMQALNLSQSATSRHLTQLTATGYLDERRCDGAKCYSLDAERLEDTLRALRKFVLQY